MFLREKGLLDYSLLLVIEQIRGPKKEFNRNIYYSSNGKEAYHMGIIDFLQDWNFTKIVENTVKGIKVNSETLSAVNPRKY